MAGMIAQSYRHGVKPCYLEATRLQSYPSPARFAKYQPTCLGGWSDLRALILVFNDRFPFCLARDV